MQRMKIGDIAELLNPTFVDKNGNKVVTRHIKHHDAILYLEDEFVLPIEVQINRINILVELMIAYLKKQDEWVSKGTLVKKATDRKFSESDIKNALVVIDGMVNIGSLYEKGETTYRWYDMPEKERKERIEQINYFDSLP